MNKLHPLLHVLICLFFSSMVFCFGSLWQLLFILLCSAAYTALRIKTGVSGVLRSILHCLPLVLSLALIQILLNREGSILWQFSFLRITHQAAYWAAVFALRLVSIVLCSKALAVLSFPQFQAAFATMHLPEEISFMISYGVHLVPIFLSQIKGYLNTLRLRGIEMNRLKIKERLQLYKIMAIAALAAVISGSTNSAIALELRGFRCAGPKSFLHESRLHAIDALAASILVILLIILLII